MRKSFLNLVTKNEITDDVVEKAEDLLDNLRPESPLRHRLWTELEELRKIATAK